MDDRRQFAFGMIEPLKEPLHPLQTKVDAFGMQPGQPGNQIAMRHRGKSAHTDGAAGTSSEAGGIVAGVAIGAAGLVALSGVGDLVNRRQSRASVGRSSWRCTTISTMPWSFRYSARWKPSGSFSRMVCSIT